MSPFICYLPPVLIPMAGHIVCARCDDLWNERRYDAESSVGRSCEEARVCVL